MLSKLFSKLKSLLSRPKKLDVYAQYTHDMGLSAKDTLDSKKPIYAYDLSGQSRMAVKLNKKYLEGIWGAPKFHVETSPDTVILTIPNVKVVDMMSGKDLTASYKEQKVEKAKKAELREKAINALLIKKEETEKKLVVRFAEPGEETDN